MIRAATAADLDQVLRIERAAFTAPHWPWDAYEQMLKSDDFVGRVLLVEVGEDERVLGFAGGSLINGMENAQLESIAVAEAARRGGLGRGLCLAFLAWAKAAGAAVVGLEVRASSLGVQKLYESLGFVAVGLRPRYYSNPVEAGVLMQCRIDEKQATAGSSSF